MTLYSIIIEYVDGDNYHYFAHDNVWVWPRCISQLYVLSEFR